MNERAYRPLPRTIAEDPWEDTAGLKQEYHALRRIQHDLENVDPREITDIHRKPRVGTQHRRGRTSLTVLSCNVKYPRQACELHSRCKSAFQDNRSTQKGIRKHHHSLLLALFDMSHSRRAVV